MTPIDWIAVMLGLAIGTAMSAAFFAGLVFGMRLALRSTKPATLLMVSAAVRITGLLSVGWLVVEQGGPWTLLGYATAFLLVRFVAITIARVGAPAGGSS